MHVKTYQIVSEYFKVFKTSLDMFVKIVFSYAFHHAANKSLWTKGKSVRGITKTNVDLSTFCTSPPNIQTLQKSVTRFCVITFEPIKI